MLSSFMTMSNISFRYTNSLGVKSPTLPMLWLLVNPARSSLTVPTMHRPVVRWLRSVALALSKTLGSTRLSFPLAHNSLGPLLSSMITAYSLHTRAALRDSCILTTSRTVLRPPSVM